MLPITLYNPPPLACRSYDPRAPNVARALGELIRSVLPDMQIEHFGSTAVPGCPGKGYIDLLVLYPEHGLETTRSGLAALGFQPQSSRDPFPEDRPMRVGSFDFDGQEYSVHAHVVAVNSAEAIELIWFRERLKANPRLREEYVAEKLRILAAGITDSVDYAYRKGAFVDRIKQRENISKLNRDYQQQCEARLDQADFHDRLLEDKEIMDRDEREDTTVYKVVVNHEEQYSIWPAAREIPLGWNDAGKSGSKQECLAYIEEVWTDMRPLSLRRKMAAESEKDE